MKASGVRVPGSGDSSSGSITIAVLPNAVLVFVTCFTSSVSVVNDTVAMAPNLSLPVYCMVCSCGPHICEIILRVWISKDLQKLQA